ncbi:hypothetical protein SNEBB_003732 [Seison nebaliae]|nr:hypothetical protein SNEBB_003732 [Seison nebaliae]
MEEKEQNVIEIAINSRYKWFSEKRICSIIYKSVFIDCSQFDFFKVFYYLLKNFVCFRQQLKFLLKFFNFNFVVQLVKEEELVRLNYVRQIADHCRLVRNGYVYPLYSVRTGLDAYFSSQSSIENFENKNYSCVMTSINIPMMSHIGRAHELNILSWQMDMLTLTPSLYHLISLLHHARDTLKRPVKYVLVAHIYGKIMGMAGMWWKRFHQLSKLYSFHIIEDVAEGFHGFNDLFEYSWLHDRNEMIPDISLYSFGIIKFCTTFGGGVAFIKDKRIYDYIHDGVEENRVQTSTQLFWKYFKYFLIYQVLNNSTFIHKANLISDSLNIDHSQIVVSKLRSFDFSKLTTTDERLKFLEQIRIKYSNFQLSWMIERFNQFDYNSFHHKQFHIIHRFTRHLLEHLTIVNDKINRLSPINHRSIINECLLFFVQFNQTTTTKNLKIITKKLLEIIPKDVLEETENYFDISLFQSKCLPPGSINQLLNLKSISFCHNLQKLNENNKKNIYCWLYPCVVVNPQRLLYRLYSIGIDTYIGATQLNSLHTIITNNDNFTSHLNRRLCQSINCHCYKNNMESSCRYQSTIQPLKSNAERRSRYLTKNHQSNGNEKKKVDIPNQLRNSTTFDCFIEQLIENSFLNSEENNSVFSSDFIMDHVIYLPINRLVKAEDINIILKKLLIAIHPEPFFQFYLRIPKFCGRSSISHKPFFPSPKLFVKIVENSKKQYPKF